MLSHPQDVGTCQVCGHVIYADVDGPATSNRLILAARAATRAHLACHTQGELLRTELRGLLPSLNAEQRLTLVRNVYSCLRAEWGEQDSVGVYTGDDALGSSAMYRLWLDAHT
jgi:hypothetical protein